MSEALAGEGRADQASRARWCTSRGAIYAILILWAIVCIFPIYWTVTTSFKQLQDVQMGRLIPFVDFQPSWLGWESLGLSPGTIARASTPRDELVSRFTNSAIV